jgi:hypothetical protein
VIVLDPFGPLRKAGLEVPSLTHEWWLQAASRAGAAPQESAAALERLQAPGRRGGGPVWLYKVTDPRALTLVETAGNPMKCASHMSLGQRSKVTRTTRYL